MPNLNFEELIAKLRRFRVLMIRIRKYLHTRTQASLTFFIPNHPLYRQVKSDVFESNHTGPLRYYFTAYQNTIRQQPKLLTTGPLHTYQRAANK